jgi:hypothetical protein
MLQYLSVQPCTIYYLWQIDVMLNNFIEVGINQSDIHILFSYENEIDIKTQYLFFKLEKKYLDVNFYFYKDNRINKNYVSSIRPNILYQFYKDYPKFSKKNVFYHDCDIVFTKNVNFNKFCYDDIWYLSDTNSYINADYIKSKGYGVYDKMCEIIEIDKSIPETQNFDSGGAQYILKNVDCEFWKIVESDSERLFTIINDYNNQIKKENPKYHELQIWCADMWALLWNAWKFGHKTKVVTEMNFCWATSAINEWNNNPIFHNAGVVSNNDGMFCKSDYQDKLPYNLDLSILNKSYCSYNYAKIVKKNYESISYNADIRSDSIS